jgi:hypothetical protein
VGGSDEPLEPPYPPSLQQAQPPSHSPLAHLPAPLSHPLSSPCLYFLAARASSPPFFSPGIPPSSASSRLPPSHPLLPPSYHLLSTTKHTPPPSHITLSAASSSPPLLAAATCIPSHQNEHLPPVGPAPRALPQPLYSPLPSMMAEMPRFVRFMIPGLLNLPGVNCLFRHAASSEAHALPCAVPFPRPSSNLCLGSRVHTPFMSCPLPSGPSLSLLSSQRLG